MEISESETISEFFSRNFELAAIDGKVSEDLPIWSLPPVIGKQNSNHVIWKTLNEYFKYLRLLIVWQSPKS